MALTAALHRGRILRAMRKALLTLLAIGLLTVPATAVAGLALRANDGTLSVYEAKGLVQISGRAAVIGRVEKGSVLVVDLTPFDAKEPTVTGWEQAKPRGLGMLYTGDKIRFRAIGGAHRLTLRGSGIDVSAVGRGTVLLDGDGLAGLYTTEGHDCRVVPARCDVVPADLTRLQLGNG